MSTISKIFILDCKFFEQILQVQRIDLIFVEVIVISFIEEWLWLFFLQEALTYNCQYLNFITISKLNESAKVILVAMEMIAKFVIMSSCVFFSQQIKMNWSNLFIVILGIVVFLCVSVLYMSIATLPTYNEQCFRYILRCRLLIKANLFSQTMANNQLVFAEVIVASLIEEWLWIFFLKEALTYTSSNIVNRRFWNEFHDPYIILYSRISKLNESAKVILLAVELISKSAIMTSCIFYSQQKTMTIASTFLTFIGIVIFLCVEVLYARIAIIPTYNEQCFRSILRWIIRTQSLTQSKPSKHYGRLYQRIQYRLLIKANLFAQTMVNNQLGFTCGHLFHINKYKFTELILMNIPLFLLLYKQACNYEN
uniref:Uncharacterized protein LOC113788524 n=1 Tax=Dermatophagoides pteronyssinus TaxID=6956 RepID=A0A6P6XPG5_DERPT|nr:uncharacterized protein LOC113788524 [Dermatophagoides pteronyssinus]